MGFTIVELLVVLAIMAVLSLLVSSGWGFLRERSEQVACANNLRGLYGGFSAYVADHRQWPQLPDPPPSATAEEDFWHDALEPYGFTWINWQCPTTLRSYRSDPGLKDNPDVQARIHYTPTRFDDKAMTPFRWAKQPWLIESSDSHRSGSLILFADGSIVDSDEEYKRMTGKSPPK